MSSPGLRTSSSLTCRCLSVCPSASSHSIRAILRVSSCRSTGKRRSVASTCAKGGITSPSTTTSTWPSRGTGIASAHGASMPARTTASATASGGASTSATSRPRRGSVTSSGTSPRAVTSASTGRIRRTLRPTPTRPSRRA